MANLYIYFTAENHWYSRLLRWAEGGSVSHVGFAFDLNPFGELWILEAEKRGVLLLPAKIYLSKKKVTRKFKCTYDALKGIKALGSHVGEWYDYKGAFLMGLWYLIKKFFRKLRRPYYQTEWQKCSELFYDFVKADGLKLREFESDPEWISPNTVLRICKSNSEKFEEIEEII